MVNGGEYKNDGWRDQTAMISVNGAQLGIYQAEIDRKVYKYEWGGETQRQWASATRR